MGFLGCVKWNNTHPGVRKRGLKVLHDFHGPCSLKHLSLSPEAQTRPPLTSHQVPSSPRRQEEDLSIPWAKTRHWKFPNGHCCHRLTLAGMCCLSNKLIWPWFTSREKERLYYWYDEILENKVVQTTTLPRPEYLQLMKEFIWPLSSERPQA